MVPHVGIGECDFSRMSYIVEQLNSSPLVGLANNCAPEKIGTISAAAVRCLAGVVVSM